jgi:hypothetical protein
MAAALSRGALRWIRLPAPKRAVWVCFQAARVLTPPPELYDQEGVFLWCVLVFLTCRNLSVISSYLYVSRQ